MYLTVPGFELMSSVFLGECINHSRQWDKGISQGTVSKRVLDFASQGT